MNAVKLDKELRKLSDRDALGAEPLNEVKLLLAGDGAQDMEIMRNLATKSRLARAENELGHRLDLEKNTLQYGETFTVAQIETLCRKYQLRFLSSRLFLGDLPVDTIAKVKEFSKEFTVSCLDQYSLQTRFFIMAPVQAFDMSHNTISVRSLRETEREEARQARLKLLAETDPVLFYKIDDTHFRLIHKWGNDFSPLRRVKGYVWDNLRNFSKVWKAAMFVAAVTLLFVARHFLAGVDWNSPKNLQDLNKDLCYGLAQLLAIGLPFIAYWTIKGHVTDSKWQPLEALFSNSGWNKEKLVKL